MSGPFDVYFATGAEAFTRGDMNTAKAAFFRALRLRKWDDPDLLDVHRRLGDIYYQFSQNTTEDLDQAEKHYVAFLRQAKALMDSPSYAITIRNDHPYVRIPERKLFDEYVAKLGGVYMAKGLSVEKAERKANRLGKSGCFIATAAYGSDMAPDVQLLRQFRDERLSLSSLGRGFIRFYEWISPSIADHIYHRENVRFMIRALLIRPLVYLTRRWI